MITSVLLALFVWMWYYPSRIDQFWDKFYILPLNEQLTLIVFSAIISVVIFVGGAVIYSHKKRNVQEASVETPPPIDSPKHSQTDLSNYVEPPKPVYESSNRERLEIGSPDNDIKMNIPKPVQNKELINMISGLKAGNSVILYRDSLEVSGSAGNTSVRSKLHKIDKNYAAAFIGNQADIDRFLYALQGFVAKNQTYVDDALYGSLHEFMISFYENLKNESKRMFDKPDNIKFSCSCLLLAIGRKSPPLMFRITIDADPQRSYNPPPQLSKCTVMYQITLPSDDEESDIKTDIGKGTIWQKPHRNESITQLTEMFAKDMGLEAFMGYKSGEYEKK